MFESVPEMTEWLQWRRWLDVCLVAVLVYQLLVLMRGTRSGSLLVALLLLLGLWYVSRDDLLDLPTVYWVLDHFIASAAVLLVVLFADDIRRALGAALRSPLLAGGRPRLTSHLVEEIVRACAELCERNLGALIVVEQQAPLDRYAGDSVHVGSEVSWQLLVALFNPAYQSPTHDGAVLIQKGRINNAGCFLPLAGGAGIPGTLGSRHRAALGLADETDALVVVVSEETATCSLAHMGQLDLHLSPADLRERLRLLGGDDADKTAWQQSAWRRRISFHSRANEPTQRPPAALQPVPDPAYDADLVRPPAPPLRTTDQADAESFAAIAEPAEEGEDT